MAYELVDALGRHVRFDRPPTRVVSLIPSITESLFELGLESSVQGVSKYCIYPAGLTDGKRKVGGQKNPDFQAIEEINPDLIILNREENKPDHIRKLGEKYPIWVTYPRQFLDTLALLRDLGGIFGVSVDDYQSEIRAGVEALHLEAAQRCRVLYLIWRNPWMSINGDTFIHDVLKLHGLDNVFAEHPERYFEVSVDEIISKNPEMIILPDEPYRFLKKHIAEFGDLPIQAVASGRVFLADGTYFCWYGTRSARTSSYIRKQILARIK
ncbi:MAG: ABC transporter substrate-binding protein [Bacteroidetes bacterium]|nr:ABC transporter substrate-binding protein [Bacteroidota bacterium]